MVASSICLIGFTMILYIIHKMSEDILAVFRHFCEGSPEHWVWTTLQVFLSHMHNTAGDSLHRRVHNIKFSTGFQTMGWSSRRGQNLIYKFCFRGHMILSLEEDLPRSESSGGGSSAVFSHGRLWTFCWLYTVGSGGESLQKLQRLSPWYLHSHIHLLWSSCMSESSYSTVCNFHPPELGNIM